MIKDKQDALDKQIYENNKKSKRKEIIAILGAALCAGFGLVTTFLNPIFGMPALLSSLGLVTTARNIKKRKEKIDSRIIQQKKHLKRVEEKGLDISKDVSNKRINKVLELKETKESKEKARKNLKLVNSLGLAGLVGSVIAAGAVAPTIGLAGSIVSAIVKLSTDIPLSKKDSEIETLKNRINNINNDLDIIRNRAKTVSFRNSDIKIKPKKEEKSTPEKKKESDSTKKNKDAVEEYLDTLTEGTQEEKPIQKVKQ